MKAVDTTKTPVFLGVVCTRHSHEERYRRGEIYAFCLVTNLPQDNMCVPCGYEGTQGKESIVTHDTMRFQAAGGDTSLTDDARWRFREVKKTADRRARALLHDRQDGSGQGGGEWSEASRGRVGVRNQSSYGEDGRPGGRGRSQHNGWQHRRDLTIYHCRTRGPRTPITVRMRQLTIYTNRPLSPKWEEARLMC